MNAVGVKLKKRHKHKHLEGKIVGGEEEEELDTRAHIHTYNTISNKNDCL